MGVSFVFYIKVDNDPGSKPIPVQSRDCDCAIVLLWVTFASNGFRVSQATEVNGTISFVFYIKVDNDPGSKPIPVRSRVWCITRIVFIVQFLIQDLLVLEFV